MLFLSLISITIDSVVFLYPVQSSKIKCNLAISYL